MSIMVLNCDVSLESFTSSSVRGRGAKPSMNLNETRAFSYILWSLRCPKSYFDNLIVEPELLDFICRGVLLKFCK